MARNSALIEASPDASVAIFEAGRKANAYMSSAKAPNTLRAYAADWRDFETWCKNRALPALPASPETVALYVSDRAGALKVSTLERRLNAINYQHRRSGHDAPTAHAGLRETMQGIRRQHDSRRDGKAALSLPDVRRMVAALPETLAGKRDRALLLLGFAGAFRRSELVALRCEDVIEVPEGLVVRVTRSKTDQEGQGQEVGIAYGAGAATCPVRALKAWLEASGIEDGPLFRPVDRHAHMRNQPLSGYAVSLIVQRVADGACVRPEASGATFGAHSLRAGHATTAARAGAEERSIMRQGRWKSERTVRAYIRHGTLFAENSSARLGL